MNGSQVAIAKEEARKSSVRFCFGFAQIRSRFRERDRINSLFMSAFCLSLSLSCSASSACNSRSFGLEIRGQSVIELARRANGANLMRRRLKIRLPMRSRGRRRRRANKRIYDSSHRINTNQPRSRLGPLSAAKSLRSLGASRGRAGTRLTGIHRRYIDVLKSR